VLCQRDDGRSKIDRLSQYCSDRSDLAVTLRLLPNSIRRLVRYCWSQHPTSFSAAAVRILQRSSTTYTPTTVSFLALHQVQPIVTNKPCRGTSPNDGLLMGFQKKTPTLRACTSSSDRLCALLVPSGYAYEQVYVPGSAHHHPRTLTCFLVLNFQTSFRLLLHAVFVVNPIRSLRLSSGERWELTGQSCSFEKDEVHST
jgi:hypothetical protein